MIRVVGEILVDLIEDVPGHAMAHPGGSPANVAVALARLGRRVDLLTQVGDDPYGRLLLTHLRDNGVELAAGSLVDGQHTSAARTSLDAYGAASYEFDIAWHRFGPPAAGWLDPAVTCVHTGSLATMLAPGADDVIGMVRAARGTALVSFDPNCRPSLVRDPRAARDRVAVLAGASDIIKASLDDLTWLYPRRGYAEIAREWLDDGARLVVVTMGGDGAWACTHHGETSVAALPVRVVDTVGAGDAFTAGLLSALDGAGLLDPARRQALGDLDGAGLTDVVAFASRVAALTCGRRGADPPTAADLAQTPA